MPKRFPLPKFEPRDAIAVVTGHRKERFPFERELALIGFGVWIRFPNNPTMASFAQLLAASNYFLNLPSRRRRLLVQSNPYFSQEAFALSLLNYQTDSLEFTYWATCNINEIENIIDILDFFMMCP